MKRMKYNRSVVHANVNDDEVSDYEAKGWKVCEDCTSKFAPENEVNQDANRRSEYNRGGGSQALVKPEDVDGPKATDDKPRKRAAKKAPATMVTQETDGDR